MKEYIEKDAAIEFVKSLIDTMSVCASIDECLGMKSMKSRALGALHDVPAANVVEVRHGRWIDMGDFISCSVCNSTRLKEFLCDYAVARRLDVRTNYCPNCGADMRGGVNDGKID